MSSIQSKLVNLSGNITGTLPIANGGTGQITASAAFNALSPITTTGDMIYSASGATNSRLAVGTTAKFLGVSGGVPAWVQALTGTADAVQLTILGNGTQTNNIFAVQKSDATELLDVTNVNGTKIRGTTTNDSAASGFVGEELKQTRLRSAAQTLTSNTSANVTASALSLTAGDWEVSGAVAIEDGGAGTTVTKFLCAISTTSATLPASDTYAVEDSTGQITIENQYSSIALGGPITQTITPVRVSISSTTSYYLVANVTFAVNSLNNWGMIRARRVR